MATRTLLVASFATSLALEEWELLWKEANPKSFAATHPLAGAKPAVLAGAKAAPPQAAGGGGVVSSLRSFFGPGKKAATTKATTTKPTRELAFTFNCSVEPDVVEMYARQHVGSRGKDEGTNKGQMLSKLRGLRTVAIETGTQYGHTTAALVETKSFAHVYSVEFSAANHKIASARFKHTPQVKLWNGDSGKLIADMLAKSASTPNGARGAVIWLDAHYTNPTGSPGVSGTDMVPLTREISAILADRHAAHHVVVMDDLRLWGKGHATYPSPSAVVSYACSKAPRAVWHMQNDHLRFRIPPR